MPSPIGHALAGVAAAWAIDLVPGPRSWRTAPASASWRARAGNGLTVVCAALAASPDLDLLFHSHRTYTHSVGATIVVALCAAAVAARLGRPVLRLSAMCTAAYGSHLLLDWMAADYFFPYGIRLLWPFSHAWFISGWDVFHQTERRFLTTRGAIWQNGIALRREVAILGPIVVALWLVRVKALAGLATELPGRDHPPQ